VRSVAITWLLLAVTASADPVPSTCYGTPEQGRLENGVALAASGPNFEAYSRLGVAVGRTCVHSIVAEIVAAAYADLAREKPATVFVYGETGWCAGGSFSPHKTHQNGTSVDFMVPVLDAAGASVPLPASPLNQFGYGIEFDASGRYESLRIDFAAVAAHLDALQRQAAARSVAIRRVIFAPELAKRLADTPGWKGIAARVPFSNGKPWVRHDEHYHVDFRPRCKPLR
jgi:penicillin-insensitive murein endopeptidase